MSSEWTGEYDVAARERWMPEAPKRSGLPREEFVRDRARVLHSSALRRLAAKTQVVIVGESDFPRTRLTHSLECAQIGRELAGSLGADPDIVDAACLAHDLGHPPFGHNGETVLAEFAAGIGGFEGNAQSLRVLTRLEAKVARGDGSSAGLNLTRAVLDAATKYPWPRSEPGTAKFGVYDDDRPVFDWMRRGSPAGQRCVEAQVMDWADDVAYSVHDVEDGVHAGHVDLRLLDDPDERDEVVGLARTLFLDTDTDVLVEAVQRLTSQPYWLRGFDGSMRGLMALKRFTSEVTGRLCGAALQATRLRSEGRPLHRHEGQFVVPIDARAECAVLKAVATRYVMRRDPTLELQTVQREQLGELLAALTDRAPDALDPWLRQAWTDAPDDAGRLRVVVDQVASLTDVSALAWRSVLVT
jgi:dGTPase